MSRCAELAKTRSIAATRIDVGMKHNQENCGTNGFVGRAALLSDVGRLEVVKPAKTGADGMAVEVMPGTEHTSAPTCSLVTSRTSPSQTLPNTRPHSRPQGK